MRRGPLIAVRANATLRATSTLYASGERNEQLVIAVSGPTDRLAQLIVFDPDQLGEAEDELDRQWVGGGGPAWLADANRLVRAGIHDRDPAKLRNLLSPDFVSIDHRPLGMGQRNGEEWIGSIVALEPGLNLVMQEIIAHTDHAVFARAAMTDSGGRSAWEYVHVLGFESGNSTRQDIFAREQFDEALARFRELS